MPLLKSIITLVPDLIGMLTKKTPKKGNDVAKASVTVGSVGAGLLLSSDQFTQINETLGLVITLIGAVTSLVGAIGVVMGKSQHETSNESSDKKD